MTKRLALALAVLVVAAGFAATAARARPPVWVARSDTATVILFGSLHVLPKDLDWMPRALADGIAKSDEVWFELPMDSATQKRVGRLARERGSFGPGESLSASLTVDQRGRLARDAAKVGLSSDSLDSFKPWLADVILSLALDEKSGAGGATGVEARVHAIAPDPTRERAFETPEEQIAFLADGPPEEQIAGLESTFDDIEGAATLYRRLVKAWMDADLKRLKRDVLDPIQRKTPSLYARLISERNARWTATLEDRLRRRGTVVVVVGMGHLIGADGVPARLRADGIAVEGP